MHWRRGQQLLGTRLAVQPGGGGPPQSLTFITGSGVTPEVRLAHTKQVLGALGSSTYRVSTACTVPTVSVQPAGGGGGEYVCKNGRLERDDR